MPAWGMPLMLPGGFSHYVVASVFFARDARIL